MVRSLARLSSCPTIMRFCWEYETFKPVSQVHVADTSFSVLVIRVTEGNASGVNIWLLIGTPCAVRPWDYIQPGLFMRGSVAVYGGLQVDLESHFTPLA